MNKLFTFGIVMVALGMMLIVGCKEKSKSEEQHTNNFIVNSEENLYRPNFHFTPNANWMNDPNGMFYLNGKYHLYFQYHPESNVWGPMHWGHAISEDLVTWQEQPIAIYPDSLGNIFSGSAVVDVNNTSGLGKDGIPPIVAIYTVHNSEEEKAGKIDFQTQAIAYSLDEGQTFKKYEGNPVIHNPQIRDFRDPKVIWDELHNKWIMVLAAGTKLMFYSSDNLINWAYESDFGEHIGIQDGVWECPDIFPLKVEGTDEVKWVLLQSINPGHINGGSGTEYYIGDFDGKTFVLDSLFAKQLADKKAIWLDYGRDNYAGVTWSNIPTSDGRKLFIGWMSNWDYAQVVPTTTWRSAMTVGRELILRKNRSGYQLCSEPVKELDNFKKIKIENENLNFKGELTLIDAQNLDVNRSVTKIELSKLNKDIYMFVLGNSDGDQMVFGINTIENYFFIDRSKSGRIEFSQKFADKISKASFDHSFDEIRIQLLVDKTSIEVFINDGETSMTEIFFPNQPMETLKLLALNKSEALIEKLEISEIGLKN